MVRGELVILKDPPAKMQPELSITNEFLINCCICEIQGEFIKREKAPH